jgi:hypothetical protein
VMIVLFRYLAAIHCPSAYRRPSQRFSSNMVLWGLKGHGNGKHLNSFLTWLVIGHTGIQMVPARQGTQDHELSPIWQRCRRRTLSGALGQPFPEVHLCGVTEAFVKEFKAVDVSIMTTTAEGLGTVQTT